MREALQGVWGAAPAAGGTRVITWAEMIENLKNGHTEHFARHPHVLAAYLERCEMVRVKYASSMGQYIKSTVFAGGAGPLRWVPNEFPYAFERGIEHHVLWSAEGALSEEAIRVEIEKHRSAEIFESVFFVNAEQMRSVREVHHAHVISRRRQ